MSNKMLPHGTCKQRTLAYWRISGKCGKQQKIRFATRTNNEQRTTTNARLTAARQYCLALASVGRVMFVVAKLPHCHSPCAPPPCWPANCHHDQWRMRSCWPLPSSVFSCIVSLACKFNKFKLKLRQSRLFFFFWLPFCFCFLAFLVLN